MQNTNLLTECASVALTVCMIALISVRGNRIGLWNSWLTCAAGGFTFVVVLNSVTPISGFASGFIMAGLTALLYWLGHERVAYVAPKSPVYASEQPAIDDIFDFQEVPQ